MRTPFAAGLIARTVLPVLTSRARCLGQREHRLDRRLDVEETAIGLHHAGVVVRDAERRKPPHHLPRVEHLMRQAMFARRAQRTRHHVAVGRADLGNAGDVHQGPAAFRFQLAP